MTLSNNSSCLVVDIDSIAVAVVDNDVVAAQVLAIAGAVGSVDSVDKFQPEKSPSLDNEFHRLVESNPAKANV